MRAAKCRPQRGVQRGLPLALLGNFQRYVVLRLGKFPNKLWYFCLNTLGKANVHITDEIPLSFSVVVSSALRIGVASSPLSALPIGTRAYRTGSRSSPYTHDSTLTCQAAVPKTSLSASCRCSVLPCRCQGNSRLGCRSPICFPLLQDWKRSSI